MLKHTEKCGEVENNPLLFVGRPHVGDTCVTNNTVFSYTSVLVFSNRRLHAKNPDVDGGRQMELNVNHQDVL